MARAKQEFTLATQAVHRRENGAAERADRAVAELTAARRELNALLDAEPASPWAESARIQADGDA
jgi:hypothetical protein